MSPDFRGNLNSDQTLLHLEERLGLGVFVWNIETDELQWSDGMFSLFGLKAGSVQPSLALVLSITHPDDRVSTGWLRHEIREGRLLDRDFRVVLRDGRVRHVSQRAWLTNGDGNNRQVAGVCIDATPLFQARAQSELIQQRFKKLVDAASCVVWTASPDANGLQPVSLASAEGLGPQGNWFDRIHSGDKDAVLKAWSQAVTSGQPFARLHRIERADGIPHWYQSHAAPLRDRDSSIIEWIGLTIDVNDLVAGIQASPRVTGAQIRGGRGILNWSVRDLANAAGLTIGIVRRLEEFDGVPLGYDDALSVILRAMETAGVEFLTPPIGKPAVRPR